MHDQKNFLERKKKNHSLFCIGTYVYNTNINDIYNNKNNIYYELNIKFLVPNTNRVCKLRCLFFCMELLNYTRFGCASGIMLIHN